MRLDQKYPGGADDPNTDVRRLVSYLGLVAGARTFRCWVCQAPTQWVLVSQHKAVCSEECVLFMVQESALSSTAHHWLLDKCNDQGSPGGVLSGGPAPAPPPG